MQKALKVISTALALACCVAAICQAEQVQRSSGALAILPSNPAYFQEEAKQ